MTASLRLLRIEFRRSLALWAFPVLALVGWFGADQYAQPAGITIWLHTSAAIGYSTLLLAPLVGGLAARAAGRNWRRGMDDLLATTPRSAAARDLIGWSSVALWCVLAYAANGLAVVLTTGSLSAWGGPHPPFIAIGLTAVLAAAGIGHLVGTLVRSRFAAPLVPIVLYAGLLYASDGNPGNYRFLSPATFLAPHEHDVFTNPTPDITLPLLLWLGGIAGTALATLAVWRRRSVIPVAIWSVMIVATGLGVVTLLDQGERGWAEPEFVSYEPVCVERSIQICVHPAYESHLSEIADVIDDLIEPLIGVPGAPTRAAQWRGPDPPPDDLLRISTSYHPRGIVVNTIDELVYGRSSGPGSGPTDGAANVVIARWLALNAGPYRDWAAVRMGSVNEELQAEINVAVERFAALDPTEQHAWLVEHFADLRAGRVTLEELP